MVFLTNGYRLLFYIEYRVGLVVALSRSLTPTILNLIIQVSLTLAKDRFIRLKSSMLYVKPKVWLSRAGDDDHPLKWGCDCAVSISSRSRSSWRSQKKEGKKIKKLKKLTKTSTTEIWLLGRVCRMHRKNGSRWIEYHNQLIS